MEYNLLLNPILISVIVLCILCLCKVNVILSLILSTIVAGLLSHFTFTKTMQLFISGMGANSETALSYILLGTFAAVITTTGLAKIISKHLEKIINGEKTLPCYCSYFNGYCLTKFNSYTYCFYSNTYTASSRFNE